MMLNVHETQLQVCCIGAGRLGVFSMLVLAHRMDYVRIHIVDDDVNLINAWNHNELPFHEPQLQTFIHMYRGNKVFFRTDIGHCIDTAGTIFLAIEAKTKEEGSGEKGRLDLTRWEAMVRQIRDHAHDGKLIIDKSPIPFGENSLVNLVRRNPNPNNIQHSVFCNPEFFSRGTAFNNLLNPDMIVLGAKSEGVLWDDTDPYYDWFDHNRILRLGVETHKAIELGKFFNNIYLGMTGIIGNFIASVSDKMGVDVESVMAIVKRDRRWHELVMPHGAIGGPGLQRDIQLAVYMCEEYNMKEEAILLKTAIKLNKKRKEEFVKKMLDMMVSLENKIVAMMGFSFKEGTDDISDSAALYICQQLLKEKAQVRVFDPLVNRNLIKSCFGPRAKLQVVDNMEQAWNGADALCIPIRSNYFVQHLNFGNMAANMRNPSFFFDFSCNPLYNVNQIRNQGFQVYALGRQ